MACSALQSERDRVAGRHFTGCGTCSRGITGWRGRCSRCLCACCWASSGTVRAAMASARRSGSVTVIQRFGGGLNLNVHFHTLLLDGVFFEGQEGALEFRPLPPPTDYEVGGVLARVAARVQRLLRRRGLDP